MSLYRSHTEGSLAPWTPRQFCEDMTVEQLIALTQGGPSHRAGPGVGDPFALKPGERKASPQEVREIINRKRAAKGLPPLPIAQARGE